MTLGPGASLAGEVVSEVGLGDRPRGDGLFEEPSEYEACSAPVQAVEPEGLR